MELSDTYLTIKSFSQGIYKEKGSRFIGMAYPVVTVEDVKSIIESARKEFHDGRHHCYAYMLGHKRLVWRVNDGGEPSGSAGKPILGQINSHGLTNILIVVVRYFGGKLLGVSGLTNAYKSGALSAINNAEIVELTVREYYDISYPYSSLNEVMKVLKEENIDHSDYKYDLACSMSINFRSATRLRVLNRLSRIEGLIINQTETRSGI
ncbi:MAG TPA: YigZ family protein [Bacteroidales bacterium]|nr:YigZ family protein [Bacteroidales bacterium]